MENLEAMQPIAQAGPRVILHKVTWQGDGGNLIDVASFARVQTAAGWETIQPQNGETEAAFLVRAEALAERNLTRR
jgi:hypothetical protein